MIVVMWLMCDDDDDYEDDYCEDDFLCYVVFFNFGLVVYSIGIECEDVKIFCWKGDEFIVVMMLGYGVSINDLVFFLFDMDGIFCGYVSDGVYF